MKPARKQMKVLFLCTGNSARSIFAEYFLRRLGRGSFEAYSAGAHPKGAVDPVALELLRERFAIEASDARSKSWDGFKDVQFDFVITVCDQAREQCPFWPGQPIIAHWGVEDPAAFVGTPEARKRKFYEVALQLHRRVQISVRFRLRSSTVSGRNSWSSASEPILRRWRGKQRLLRPSRRCPRRRERRDPTRAPRRRAPWRSASVKGSPIGDASPPRRLDTLRGARPRHRVQRGGSAEGRPRIQNGESRPRRSWSADRLPRFRTL